VDIPTQRLPILRLGLVDGAGKDQNIQVAFDEIERVSPRDYVIVVHVQIIVVAL
jgi:hypothetical protein